MKKSLISDISLLLVAMVWGSGFIATQMAIDSGMSAGLILLLRFTIAAVVLFVAFHRHLHCFSKQEIIYGSVTGLLLFLSFYSQTVGLRFTSTSNNAFLTGTNVVMVPFVAWALFKRRPASKVFVSAAICLFGMGVLTYSAGEGIVFNLGDYLTILCAFLFACHIAFLGLSAQKISTQKLIFLQMAVAAVLSVPAFVLFELNNFMMSSLNGLPAVIYLGIFSTCLAFFGQTLAQKHTSPAKTAVILSTESLFGSLFSVVLGYDSLTLNLFLGGIIIIVSILMLELNPRKTP